MRWNRTCQEVLDHKQTRLFGLPPTGELPRPDSLAGRVLAWFASRGEAGGTDQECQMELSLPGDSQRPKRISLVKATRLRASGRTRLTGRGRRAIVWVYVP